jgi:hypothetical protein
MTLIPRWTFILLAGLPALAAAQSKMLRLQLPSAPAEANNRAPTPKLTVTAESALNAFSELAAFQAASPNICHEGGRAWAKVYAAQLAYRDVGRAVYDIGEACSDVGSEDILFVEKLIPARIQRMRKPEAFKAQCLEAWQSRIAIEKAFIKGPEKIIETFQANCYQEQAENTGAGAGAR